MKNMEQRRRSSKVRKESKKVGARKIP